MYTHEDVPGGTMYEYRVRAVNGNGEGPWSDTASVSLDVPARAPDAPVLTATVTGPKDILLEWTVPNSNGSPSPATCLRCRTGSPATSRDGNRFRYGPAPKLIITPTMSPATQTQYNHSWLHSRDGVLLPSYRCCYSRYQQWQPQMLVSEETADGVPGPPLPMFRAETTDGTTTQTIRQNHYHVDGAGCADD